MLVEGLYLNVYTVYRLSDFDYDRTVLNTDLPLSQKSFLDSQPTTVCSNFRFKEVGDSKSEARGGCIRK